jgi:hypothetical protein
MVIGLLVIDFIHVVSENRKSRFSMFREAAFSILKSSGI